MFSWKKQCISHQRTVGFVIVITGSINQAQSQKQWSTESDVLLLEKVNIRHFEGNADAWLFTWKENLVPFLSNNLSVWTSSLCIPVKIYYVSIIHESIAALNNPFYHRFRKKQDISSSSECLSNLAHSTCIVQAPISYIFITLSSLSHCAMNADETLEINSDLSYLGFVELLLTFDCFESRLAMQTAL